MNRRANYGKGRGRGRGRSGHADTNTGIEIFILKHQVDLYCLMFSIRVKLFDIAVYVFLLFSFRNQNLSCDCVTAQ